MAISNSHLSYTDCYEAFDKAIADAAGIRVLMDSEASATFFRMRCHQARKIDRERNMKAYPSDHPMYGTSVYDPITLKIKVFDDDCYVYFERTNVSISNVESLSDLPEVERKQVRLIEHKPIIDEQFVGNEITTHAVKRRI